MHSIRSFIIYTLSLSTFLPTSVVVEAHGYLKSPRSRNWVAQEDGVSQGGPGSAGKPEQDFCPHCLNGKAANNLCSKGNAATLYDKWLDINGNPMPWESQGTYEEGGIMDVEAVLTTNHAGHMDMYICPDGDDSTQQCLWDNPLTMIKDEMHGGPTDENYPERAYFANDQSQFKFKYKLPEGVCGTNVLVQWRYITANSCFPPGYKNTAVGEKLLELGWLRASGMSDCQYPYDPTGATGSGKPEQFWNCAEITIECSNPTVSPAPTPPPQPTPEPKPTSYPTKAPIVVEGPGYCNYNGCNGVPQGGEWCNVSRERCEGNCNGTWCVATTNAPTRVPATKSPTASPTGSPTTQTVQTMQPSIATEPPTKCEDDPSDKFFLKMKKNGKPVYKTCNWLSKKSEKKQKKFCRKNTDSYNGVPPANEVCKVICGTCSTTKSPTKSPTAAPEAIVTKSPTDAPTKSPTAAPIPSTPAKTATTTRYWDCSGGSCGCAYLPFGPGTDSEPAHCYSNAMFAAPAGNQYGAKYYGTAAISQALGGGNWLSEGCGKCWRVQGSANIGPNNHQTTLVLKGTNYCPPGNPACSGNKAHFDISAPGFDVTQYSLSNTCPEREPDEIDGFEACGRWMIDSQNPDENCNCSLFKDSVLRAGCENFYSLMWNNARVTYEEVDCPEELSRLNCWEENGGGYPDDVPQFCASNI